MSSLPKKLPRYVVEFAYGDAAGTFARFANWTSDVTHDGDVYTSIPKFSVEVPANTGMFEERPLVLEAPIAAHALFAALSSGEQHSPAYVTVTYLAEPLPDDGGSATALVACLGWRVTRATKNPSGKRGIVRLEAVSAKSEMNKTVGLPANYQCAWTLFGRGCDLAQLSDAGTLTAIDAGDKQKVTITGIAADPGVPGPTPGNVYHRGYVERDGLRIEIRDYSSAAPTIFFLARKPPASWVGQAVTVIAGCDKTIETCRARYDNEGRFMGCGYGIVDRHPVHELPSL